MINQKGGKLKKFGYIFAVLIKDNNSKVVSVRFQP